MSEAALSHTTPIPIPRRVPEADWLRKAREARGVFYVETEQDIVAAVLAARHNARALHPIGSRGSKNGCCAAPDLALRFDRYDRVLSLDGPAVSVQAGATVGALNAVLRRHGLAVPTCGEWAGATVGGSIGTGSHGGSSRHGIHSTSLRSVRLITAAGSPLEIRRGDPHFEHIGVSLGLLGVISTLTFECDQWFYLELETRVLPFERYLATQESLIRENEFFSATWIPTARRVITFVANRVPAPIKTARRMERYNIKTFLLNAASQKLDVNLVCDRLLARTVVDEGDRILAPIQDKSKRVHFLRFLSKGWKEMEGAVSQDRAVEALLALDQFLAKDGRALTNPVGLRPSAADGFSLSPCQGRDTFWIDFFFRGNGRFVSGLRDLLESLDARCHWGKHVGLSAPYLEKQHPRISAFRGFRTSMDPEGLFENPFARSFNL